MDQKKGCLFFSLLFFEEEYQRGKFITLEKAKLLRSAIWAKLPKTERQAIELKARATDVDAWFHDCVMYERKHLEKLKQRRMLEDLDMKEFIDRTLRADDWDQQVFYLFSVQHFYMNENEVFPGELALAKFSIKEGLIVAKSMRINPGNLPMGTFSEAKFTSEETHMLPLPPDCEGEKDFGKVKTRIQKFLGGESDPIVFVKQYPKRKDLEVARKTLSKIWSDDEGLPRVCALDELLFQMALKFDAEKRFKSVEKAREFLEQDSLIIEACDYHTEVDKSSFCCLSRVRRWAYWILQHLLDPQVMLPGKHHQLPAEVQAEEKKLKEELMETINIDEEDLRKFLEDSDEDESDASNITVVGAMNASTNPFMTYRTSSETNEGKEKTGKETNEVPTKKYSILESIAGFY